MEGSWGRDSTTRCAWYADARSRADVASEGSVGGVAAGGKHPTSGMPRVSVSRSLLFHAAFLMIKKSMGILRTGSVKFLVSGSERLVSQSVQQGFGDLFEALLAALVVVLF